jgi:hypothetical protein
VNRIERQVRNMINPYSTAFATWWCHSSRHWRLSRKIKGSAAVARPGLPKRAVHRFGNSVAGQATANAPAAPVVRDEEVRTGSRR